jgi:hypothetical protein
MDEPMDWFYPVQCLHCGGVYDAGSVTVTARYLDCSVWLSPCCHRTVDDRPEGWGGGIRKITKGEANRLTMNGRAKMRRSNSDAKTRRRNGLL